MAKNVTCAECATEHKANFWGPSREAKTQKGYLLRFCSSRCRRSFLLRANAKIFCHKP